MFQPLEPVVPFPTSLPSTQLPPPFLQPSSADTPLNPTETHLTTPSYAPLRIGNDQVDLLRQALSAAAGDKPVTIESLLYEAGYGNHPTALQDAQDIVKGTSSPPVCFPFQHVIHGAVNRHAYTYTSSTRVIVQQTSSCTYVENACRAQYFGGCRSWCEQVTFSRLHK